jgi:hypothetical protein
MIQDLMQDADVISLVVVVDVVTDGGGGGE